MKIEQEEVKFQPIVITLESRKEAEILLAIVARVVGNGLDDGMVHNMFAGLGGNEAMDASPYRAIVSHNGNLNLTEKKEW